MTTIETKRMYFVNEIPVLSKDPARDFWTFSSDV